MLIACFASCEGFIPVPDNEDPENQENTGNENGNNNGNETTGHFTRKQFNTTREFVDFFPTGYAMVFEYEDLSWSNEKDVYAKPSDGSFVHSTIDNEPSSSKYNYTEKFYIWEGSNYHELHHTNYDYVTEYWTVQGNFTGENVVDGVQMEELGSVAVGTFRRIKEGHPDVHSAFSALVYSGCMGFIQSDKCEYVEFEKDTTISGIDCKKYILVTEDFVYNGQVLTEGYIESWYVLGNGFCLKYNSNSSTATSNFELTEAKPQVTTYNDVIQDFYRAKEPLSPLPASLAEWDIITHVRTKEWFNPQQSNYVIPWEDGIDYMTCWYEYRYSETLLHTYDVIVDIDAATVEALTAYKEKVRALPDFVVTTDSDTDDPKYREAYRLALEQYYPDYTEEELEAAYQQMEEYWATFRSFEFKGNNETEHPNISFGDSYYYIDYSISGFHMKDQNTGQCVIKICWVRVTIV